MIGQQLCGYNVVIFFSISIFEAAHTPLGHIFLQITHLKTHLKPTPYLKEVGFSLCFRENALLINLKGVTKKTGQTFFVILHRLIQFQKRALYHQKGHIHSFQNWYYNFI